MDEIKNEFEAYLKELVASYPKLQNTGDIRKNLKEKTDRSHDFNNKVEFKFKEILSNNPQISNSALRIELAFIRVHYQTKLTIDQ